MNGWVCTACNATDGLRTIDDTCEHCGSKVIYRELREPKLYVIGEPETDGKFKREKEDE